MLEIILECIFRENSKIKSWFRSKVVASALQLIVKCWGRGGLRLLSHVHNIRFSETMTNWPIINSVVLEGMRWVSTNGLSLPVLTVHFLGTPACSQSVRAHRVTPCLTHPVIFCVGCVFFSSQSLLMTLLFLIQQFQRCTDTCTHDPSKDSFLSVRKHLLRLHNLLTFPYSTYESVNESCHRQRRHRFLCPCRGKVNIKF